MGYSTSVRVVKDEKPLLGRRLGLDISRLPFSTFGVTAVEGKVVTPNAPAAWWT